MHIVGGNCLIIQLVVIEGLLGAGCCAGVGREGISGRVVFKREFLSEEANRVWGKAL